MFKLLVLKYSQNKTFITIKIVFKFRQILTLNFTCVYQPRTSSNHILPPITNISILNNSIPNDSKSTFSFHQISKHRHSISINESSLRNKFHREKAKTSHPM